MWSYRSYVSARGEVELDHWFVSLTGAERLKAYAFLSQYAEWDEAGRWPVTWAKPLKGDGKGLVELRLRLGNVQHRLLGQYGPLGYRRTFTVVLCTIEKGTIPKADKKTALARLKDVEGDPERRSRPWQLPGSEK